MSFINHTSGYPNGSSGNFYLIPYIGDIKEDQVNFGSTFSHTNETVSPGYYAVYLQDSFIKTEMTVSPHAGFCKFEGPQGKNVNIVFSDYSDIKVVGADQIVGQSGGWFFYAKVNQPVIKSGHLANKFFVELKASTENSVLIKSGFSKTNGTQAKNNLLEEIPDWDFERIRRQAFNTWNNVLSTIKVKGGTREQKEIFYTSLYHSLLDPHLESDVNQPPRYSQLSPWDTFRSKHPLITLLWPDKQLDMIKSVLDQYKITGQLPPGPMTGNHNVAVLVDSYFKGLKDFDIKLAYEAMKKALLAPHFVRPDVEKYLQYGYVPAEQSYSVTKTLEYAYNDWALAEFAKNCGFIKDSESFYKRSLSYQQIFNPATKFMQAKTKAGDWADEGFREGDQWTYSWFVPHDVQGLINLMGGKERFSKKLELCFSENHYVHDNEPPLHYAYLFNYADTPWLTQKWVNEVREINYSAAPGGLPGNDDLGALSAWYVFSAMGFYPVCPGRPVYDFGVPLFDEMTVQLFNGKILVIKAKNNLPENKYVSAIKFNNKVVDWNWISHEKIMNGGILEFEKSPIPNKEPGENKAAESLTTGKPDFRITDFRISEATVKANGPFTAKTTVQNFGDAPGTFDFIVTIDNTQYKTESVFLKAKTDVTVKTKIILFTGGEHILGVSPELKRRVVVKEAGPEFVFSNLLIPTPPVVAVGDSATFTADIQNIGSFEGTVEVELLLDNKKIQLKKVKLGPGELNKVVFVKVFKTAGLKQIAINNLGPQKLRVYQPGEPPKSIYIAQQYAPVLVLGFDFGPSTKIQDLSTNGNDARVINNVNWVPGIYGQAIQTNALNKDYVEILDSGPLQKTGQSKTLSMMAWIFPMDEKNFADFFTQGDWNVLQLRATNTAANFYSGGYQRGEAYAATPENWDRRWHHIAGVTEGNFQKMYIDGKLVSEKEIEILTDNGTAFKIGNINVPWNIGRNAQNPERFFNGYIDDVRIYLKALPQEEIKKVMLNEINN